MNKRHKTIQQFMKELGSKQAYFIRTLTYNSFLINLLYFRLVLPMDFLHTGALGCALQKRQLWYANVPN